MPQAPTLNITLSQEDFDDLSNGLYELHFTRLDVATKKLPGVWAYKALDGSTKVKGKSEDTREGIEN
jgi:hypothetical protein